MCYLLKLIYSSFRLKFPAPPISDIGTAITGNYAGTLRSIHLVFTTFKEHEGTFNIALYFREQ